jgi:hypothetical protein
MNYSILMEEICTITNTSMGGVHKNPKSLGFTRSWNDGSSGKENKNKAFYRRYTAMRARCSNKNAREYHTYGGKGVCVEWSSFRDFYDDMYESFVAHTEKFGISNTTLDRVDTNGNYTKSNCRWATRSQQSKNSSVPRLIEYRGVTDSISGWARKYGMWRITLARRLFQYGMSFEDAVSAPVIIGRNMYYDHK